MKICTKAQSGIALVISPAFPSTVCLQHVTRLQNPQSKQCIFLCSRGATMWSLRSGNTACAVQLARAVHGLPTSGDVRSMASRPWCNIVVTAALLARDNAGRFIPELHAVKRRGQDHGSSLARLVAFLACPGTVSPAVPSVGMLHLARVRALRYKTHPSKPSGPSPALVRAVSHVGTR